MQTKFKVKTLVLKSIVLSVLAAFLSVLPARAAERFDCGLGRVIYNDDGCEMLVHPVGAPATYEQFVSCRLARDLPGSAITAVAYCPVCSGFGHFTALKMGDTLTNAVPAGSTWRGQKVCNAVTAFAAKGLDALEMSRRYVRQQGRAYVVSIRMDDTHDWPDRPDKPHYLYSPFKRRHPECVFGTYKKPPPYGCWSGVDFAQKAVREAFVGYMREFVANYEADAVELDFFRHLPQFRSLAWGAEAASDEERNALTDMMRQVRTILANGRRCRPKLIVRTPDSESCSRAAGIDIETWLKEDLVDAWVGAGYYRLRPWRQSVALAHRYGKPFYASLDDSRVDAICKKHKLPFLPGRGTVANFAARVAAATEEGCDGVELFNFDDYTADQRAGIGRLAPDRTNGLDKDYFVVSRSWNSLPRGNFKNERRFFEIPEIDPASRSPLKLAANETYRFALTLADDFTGCSAQAKVTAELLLVGAAGKAEAPVLAVNGRRCSVGAGGQSDVFVCKLPVECLCTGENVFELTTAVAAEFRDFVVRVRHGF